MHITFAGTNAEFRPWRPAYGQVFKSIFAFDSETTLIDEQHPWISPAYVLGAAFDGRNGYFISREHAAAFFTAHAEVPVAMHNAPFDLAVLDVLAPELGVYDRVEQNLVWDTQLLHRLHMLGVQGHTAAGKGQSTLEHCAAHYLGIKLAKDLCDSVGDDVRLSYGKWLNKRPPTIEPIYLEYLAKDAMVTYQVFLHLWSAMGELISGSHRVWGYVSPQWLTDQITHWGPQTHHIQLKAAIVLKEITANGLHLDLERREEVVRQLTEVADEKRSILRSLGYTPGQKGSEKALQEILRGLQRVHNDLPFPRTETGKYVTKREVLEELADTEPFIKNLVEYRALNKLLSSFLCLRMVTQRLTRLAFHYRSRHRGKETR